MNAIARYDATDQTPADAAVLSAAFFASAGSMAVSENGRILYANAAFAQTFGMFHGSQLTGCALAELFPQAPTSGFRMERSPFGHAVFHSSRTRADGKRVLMQASYAEFHIESRELLVISTREINRHERARQQSIDSQKMEAIGRLVAGVAHDFNNLLTGIILYCDLLLAGLAENSRMQQHARAIRVAGEHGAALIEQLMAAARKQMIKAQPLSWNQVILEMHDLLARLIGENIELVTDLVDGIGSVEIDPSQARQIVMNVVLNARDAMPQGGRVTMATRNLIGCLCHSKEQVPSPKACVELTFTDCGSGMDAETCSHVFEPFFSTKGSAGNGLGLSTVHSIVTKQGGAVHLESAPGKGTRVFIHLPRVPDEVLEQQ